MAQPALSLDLQGHRGARGLLPENTLPAFARALDLSMTTLELDVGMTRDGVVVVAHDRTLNPDVTRDANGAWLKNPTPAIWHLTHSGLTRYDVGRLKPGTDYAKRFSRQQAIDGTRIPTLAEVFALVASRRDEKVRFNIETKLSPLAPDETATPEALVKALLGAIRKAGMESRVTIQSFDWRTLAIVQKAAPAIPTVYLSAEGTSPHNIPTDGSPSPWTAGHQLAAHGGSLPRMVKAAGGAVWSPYHGNLTRERVREARALGLKVVVWTVNNEADVRRFVEWDVDGIISDYPDMLAAIAAAPR